MRLPVPLQDVRTLLIVDVSDGETRVGRDALAAQPGGVCGAKGRRREGREVRDRESGGGYAGTVSEDAAAGGGAQHGVA